VSLVADQQLLTPVARYAQWHAAGDEPAQAAYYRDLVPLSLPRSGEQYAFEVDLDACSGCKACVVACHHLNGLEARETWRSVGVLHGGSDDLPVIQHVTTACHHCLEPACLSGCPVHAYEKDPQTGIVRHLDDQCIGCQYCILQCPYDVPQYSASKGIVRKCDMCHGRLAAGEAPACVQACPNAAIRITIVSQQQVREESEANLFLPGAPEPGYTLPATVYKTKRPLPRNLLPADYYSVSRQHAHLPLVFMLVLTQMSVGAFAVDQLLRWFPIAGETASLATARAVQCAAAILPGLVGLAASTLHLGRPQYAYRALLGLRTSWLSREILAFGVFALFAIGYAALSWLAPAGSRSAEGIRHALGALVVTSGMVGVFCSVMIYASTRRPFWNAPLTGLKFILTAALLGGPTALLIWLAAAAVIDGLTVNRLMADFGAALCAGLAALAAVKLLAEAAVFLWLPGRRFTPLKRTALLLAGELGPLTLQRFAMGLAGGVVLPLVLAMPYLQAGGAGHRSPFVLCAVAISAILLTVGELFERYSFFAAVVAPKMPGAPAS
jgi:Fe-S-cluster-containing dehydrogenase component/DMSO reductase anchor subunit